MAQIAPRIDVNDPEFTGSRRERRISGFLEFDRSLNLELDIIHRMIT